MSRDLNRVEFGSCPGRETEHVTITKREPRSNTVSATTSTVAAETEYHVWEGLMNIFRRSQLWFISFTGGAEPTLLFLV